MQRLTVIKRCSLGVLQGIGQISQQELRPWQIASAAGHCLTQCGIGAIQLSALVPEPAGVEPQDGGGLGQIGARFVASGGGQLSRLLPQRRGLDPVA